MIDNQKKDFGCTTFTEVKTWRGQLIEILCRPEDKEKFKEKELEYFIRG